MSNYTITTPFAGKDALPDESADKIIRGSEFATEFNNIATAVNSKADSSQVLTNVPNNAVFTDTVYTKPSSEPISYITGLQTALDGKVSTTDADYVKLTNVNATATEINYLDGVTSNIQEQIDNIDTGGGSGDYVSSTDPDYIKLTQVNATAVELNYVDGVTSNIQSQLNALLGRIQFLEEEVLGGGQ